MPILSLQQLVNLVNQLFNLAMTANRIVSNRTLLTDKLAKPLQFARVLQNLPPSESPKSSKAMQPNQSKEKGEIH